MIPGCEKDGVVVIALVEGDEDLLLLLAHLPDSTKFFHELFRKVVEDWLCPAANGNLAVVLFTGEESGFDLKKTVTLPLVDDALDSVPSALFVAGLERPAQKPTLQRSPPRARIPSFQST
eukprot:CAMPEP_0206463406 /NCGR_PEP_ID=MMETSP0324_2-20121206/26581_1 /ASSEMBLY_ACC=CAM_ASM_000836 /TAXON_ID=2866 /ORGANISM="Crypthecodinium cohnii, Strain Seligo" /LENGTH=119 /DNA_ID=CAMNT_0053935799 /DNA_START=302 /DNA_END=658 /DNA_ORIENTATION=-